VPFSMHIFVEYLRG